MKNSGRIFIGVDAGATKISAVALDADGRMLRLFSGAGTNAVSDGPELAARRVADLIGGATQLGKINCLVVGLAGGWSSALARRMRKNLKILTGAQFVGVINDVAALLLALPPGLPALVLNIGTGSVIVGGSRGFRRPPAIRIDGWGPLAGDAGSGFWIGQKALVAALAAYDGRGPGTLLQNPVFRSLGLKRPASDIRRLYTSQSRGRIASLAPLAVNAWRAGDPVARSILREAAESLTCGVSAALRMMPAGRVRLIVSGGLAQAAPELLRGIRALARKRLGRIKIVKNTLEPEAACLLLALKLRGRNIDADKLSLLFRGTVPRRITRRSGIGKKQPLLTERMNPDTASFSRLPALEQLRLMNREDLRVAPAVAKILPQAARAVRLIEKQLRRGGRLIYVGAGTSGRLGVLDAAEAPPTFGVRPGLVRGIIAGGLRALSRSVEGAEDSQPAGRAAMRRIGIGKRDAVIGLSASGSAPFVLGALGAARKRGAACLAITCNARTPLRRKARISLEPLVGPEAISGSTRLKAGTAQKMLLNMLSTCVMARLGLISGNRMINLVPSNRKLRERAVAIVAQELAISRTAARQELEENCWSLAATLKRNVQPAGFPDQRRHISAVRR